MISELIIDKVVAALQKAMIDDIPEDDPTRAGVIMKGPLQGNPDDDVARISLTVYEGDPDNFHSGMLTSITGLWNDEIEETYIGGGCTWNRRFTVKARCLLVNTRETLAEARSIASTVRKRIEKTLLAIDWTNTGEDDEWVCREVLAATMKSEAIQGGGPPDSYDYSIKVRFDVQTDVSI